MRRLTRAARKSLVHTVFSFLHFETLANSNSCRNISIFYLINLLFEAETIQGWKLFKGRIYMRNTVFIVPINCFSALLMFSWPLVSKDDDAICFSCTTLTVLSVILCCWLMMVSGGRYAVSP